MAPKPDIRYDKQRSARTGAKVKRRKRKRQRKRSRRDAKAQEMNGLKGHIACGRKIAFSRRRAEEIAKAHLKRGHGTKYIYKCSYCGHWHITHKKDGEHKTVHIEEGDPDGSQSL